MSIKNYNTIQNSNGVNKKIFVAVLLVILMAGLFAALIPQQVLAQEDPPERNPCELNSRRDFEKAVPMQLAIPGVTYEFNKKHYVKDMACYISGIYRYFAGVAGILCVVMIMYGGIKYVVSMGNPQKISDAQDTIVSAILGLALTLGSFTILYFINPNLTTLTVEGISRIDPIFVDTMWCEDYESEPKVDGKTNCNDRGKMLTGKERGGECVYKNCQQAGKFCIRGSNNDPHDLDNYHCGNPREECNKTVEQGDITEDVLRGLCRSYSYYDPDYPEISGECRVITRPWTCADDWLGFIGAKVKCYYFPLLDCETFLGDTWTEAQSCSGDCQDSCSMGWIEGGYDLCNINKIIFGDNTKFDVVWRPAHCSDQLVSTTIYMADYNDGTAERSSFYDVNQKGNFYISRCCQKIGTNEFKPICTGRETIQDL